MGPARLTAAAGQVFTIGASGGTIIAAGAGTVGKLSFTSTGNLAGTGTFTKSGSADLQINSPNVGFSGNVVIVGGFIEDQNAASFGATTDGITISGVTASTPTGSIVTGSEAVTVASTTGLVVGQGVTGTGIIAGTYITSITNGTTFQLSAAATATNAAAALTIAAQNGELIASGGAIISNPLTIAGTGTLSTFTSGGVFAGSLTVPASGTFNIAPRAFNATTTGTTVTITGAISGGASLAISSTQTSLGNVILGGNNTNWTAVQGTSGNPFLLASNQGLEVGLNGRPLAATGSFATLSGGNFGALSDGDGTGTPNVAGTFTDTFNVTASSSITVGPVGAGNPIGSSLFLTPLNKTINESNAFTLGAFTLTATNNSGYGLNFTSGFTLNGATASTLKAANATYSDQTQGLTLSGVVSSGASASTAANATILTISGGNVAFTNTGNTFGTNTGGIHQLITVTGGQLAFTGSGSTDSLGNAGNVVENTLNSAGPNVGLRAFGGTVAAPLAFSTSRNFFLGGATANDFEVAPFTTVTLNTGLAVVAAANVLDKTDDGTLILGTNFNSSGTAIAGITPSTTWTGGITINAGAVELLSNTAAGTGTITLNVRTQVALQLANSVTIANPVNLNADNNSGFQLLGGINSHGALESVSGANITSGLLTVGSQDNSIGADAGSLTINGGVNVNGHQLGFLVAGGATINLNSAFVTTAPFGVEKTGAGTLTILANQTLIDTSVAFTVYNGTAYVGGPGSASGTTLTLGKTIGNIVFPGATLTVDDSVGTATANRLGGAGAFTMNGGTFNYVVSATASSESLGTGVLTINPGGATININDTAGGTSAVSFASVTQNAGSSLAFTGSGTNALGTANNKITFTTAPTLTGGAVAATNGLLARDIITNGTSVSFATYNTNGVATNTNGIQAYAGYDNNGAYTNINSAAATDTVEVGTGFVTTSAINSFSQTLNALYLNGSGLTVSGTAQSGAMTLTSGGVLFNGVGNTISVPVIAQGATEYIYHVAGGTSTATISSAITGTAGLTKADAGILTLSSADYYTGTTIVNGGTLQLAGGTNTLFFNNSLVVNSGATLDLNGGVQYAGSLSSSSTGISQTTSGGTITSLSGAASTLLVNSGAATFAGSITGNVTFIRSGSAGQYNLLGNNSYTGPTLIEGGGTFSGNTLSGVVLTDNGALSGTSAVTINYSSLTLDNTTGTLTDSSSRINASAGITLNGGSFNFVGRAASPSNETFNGLTLASGNSIVSTTDQSNIGNPTSSATITFASLSRTAANGATVEFAQNYQNNSTGNLGLINDAAGHAENILFSAAPGLTNNIIGGWAIVTGNGTVASGAYFNTGTAEFASYIPTLGIGGLNTAGFAGYDNGATGTLPATLATSQNLRLTGSTLLPSGGAAVNSLNLVQTTASSALALTFTNPTDQLVLTSGGLLVQNVGATSGATSLGTSGTPGQITSAFSNGAGGNDLYLYYYNVTAANVLTVNSAIVNNGSTPVRLVAYGSNFGAGNITLAGVNTYSGGTVVNGETLTIGATGTLPAGGLTINGGTVSENNGNGGAAGVVGSLSPQAVALNGPSTLTLIGTNTLTSLTFNNNGGSANPTVAAGTLLALSGGAITASSSNVGFTNTLSGTTVNLGGGAATITVNPIAFNSQNLAPWQATLNISAVLTGSTGVSVSGGGVLQLSGANTFTGNLSLAANTGLIIGVSSNPTTVGSGNSLTTSPLGLGQVSLGANSYLLSSGAFTVANNVTAAGDFAFDGATNGLTLNGTLLLGAASNTNITVAAPGVTLGVGGVVSGTSGITKLGLGTPPSLTGTRQHVHRQREHDQWRNSGGRRRRPGPPLGLWQLGRRPRILCCQSIDHHQRRCFAGHHSHRATQPQPRHHAGCRWRRVLCDHRQRPDHHRAPRGRQCAALCDRARHRGLCRQRQRLRRLVARDQQRRQSAIRFGGVRDLLIRRAAVHAQRRYAHAGLRRRDWRLRRLWHSVWQLGSCPHHCRHV